MTIDEAIKILQPYLDIPENWTTQGFDEALQLGVEALKAVKKIRRDGYWSANGMLPGETKE